MTNEEKLVAVETYNDYINRMILTVQHIIDDLQASDFRQSTQAMTALFDAIDMLFTNAGNLLGVHYQELEKVVRSCGAAMENKDNVLLRDLFEFELIPLLEQITIESHRDEQE